jgi:anti-sigma-K factor RskA
MKIEPDKIIPIWRLVLAVVAIAASLILLAAAVAGMREIGVLP